MANPTLGERRVRFDFNPSANEEVVKIKRLAADFIDLCEALKNKDVRLAALAQTAIEEASMWAVKAATTEPVDDTPSVASDKKESIAPSENKEHGNEA